MNRKIKKRFVLAYDVGTSSTKTILLDIREGILSSSEAAYPFRYPNPGWVEQNPEDYWNAVCQTTRDVLSQTNASPHEIIGLAFSTQAMGIIAMDPGGRVLHPNITWVDARAQEEAKWLMNRFLGRKIFKKIVGIEVTGKDVIPKLIWLKNKRPQLFGEASHIVDVNGYMKFKATGKMAFEWSGACSYAFNLKKKDWEYPLFRFAGIDTKKFPSPLRSIDVVGGLTKSAARELRLVEGTPVYGGCDDTQSAAIGTGAADEGEAHIYLGTSAWVGVTTSRVHRFRNGSVCLQSADPGKNLVVGITESAGNNLEWFIQTFFSEERKHLPSSDLYKLLDAESAGTPPGADHLIFTPWLLGERCPVATTTTRGTIFNLGLEHTRGHLVRAIGEGVGYNLKWIIHNMRKDFKFPFNTLRITGGGSQNDQWMQAFADILQLPLETTNLPKMAGSVGAAMCVLVGSGILSGFSEVKRYVKRARLYQPDEKNKSLYDDLYLQYKSLYFSLRKNYRMANLSRFAN